MSALFVIHAVQEVKTSQPTVRICSHIKDDGIRCGTPALNGRNFCYYHARAHHQGPHPQTLRLGERTYRGIVPETIESLQLGIMQVTESLGSGRITDKTAGKLLYAIQLASNLLRMQDAKNANLSDRQPITDNREPVPTDVVDDSTSEPGSTEVKSPDHEITRSPDVSVVTEIPPAMEEVLAPRPMPDAAAALDLLPEVEDTDLPATVEEAERALLKPEQTAALFKALRKCDRISPRYEKLQRRMFIHERAFDVLKSNGVDMSWWLRGLSNVPD